MPIFFFARSVRSRLSRAGKPALSLAGVFSFRNLWAVLAALVFLFSGLRAVSAESVLETPAPARIHTAPEPTAETPLLLDRIKNPSSSVRFRLDAKLLHIWFPNIMNADEAVLQYDGETWLIDCGDEKMGARGVKLMRQIGVEKIDKLFNTHPHHDHLNGLAVTNEAVPVRQLLICFPPDATEHMVNALAYAESAGIEVEEYTDGDVFSMGDGRVTLTFYCNQDDSLDLNNNSAVTLLQYGNRRMLFTADVERPGQAVLVSRVPADNLRADILRYPHHGKSGLLDEFMEAVSPSCAIITNARVNWGGVEYLSWRNIPFYFTNPADIYLHLYTDGSIWVIEQVPIN